MINFILDNYFKIIVMIIQFFNINKIYIYLTNK